MNGENNLTLHETMGHVGVVTMNNGNRLKTKIAAGERDYEADAPEAFAVDEKIYK